MKNILDSDNYSLIDTNVKEEDDHDWCTCPNCNKNLQLFYNGDDEVDWYRVWFFILVVILVINEAFKLLK